MTVCIAGINYSNSQPLIIAACDRKVSFFGGWASAEGIAMKLRGLNDDWSVMFSGPNSPMTALVDAISERTAKARPRTYRDFARLCRTVYREERKPLIESDVLGKYDVDSYTDYMQLKKSDPAFYEELTKKIKQEEEEWNLLFAGFDKERRPHIFTIAESGEIGFSDIQGYAVIGSGALRALLSLSSYPFRKRLGLSEAVFAIAASKFAAEAADGVGEETVLTILEPKTPESPTFGDDVIRDLRIQWKNLPRFPKDATKTIWEEIVSFQQYGFLSSNKSLKPSASERVLFAG